MYQCLSLEKRKSVSVLTSVHDKQVNFLDEIYVFRHSFVGQMEWSIISGCP